MSTDLPGTFYRSSGYILPIFRVCVYVTSSRQVITGIKAGCFPCANCAFPPGCVPRSIRSALRAGQGATRPLDGGETPPYHPKNSKERPYGRSASYARIRWEGVERPSHAHPAKKAKALLWMVGVGRALVRASPRGPRDRPHSPLRRRSRLE